MAKMTKRKETSSQDPQMYLWNWGLRENPFEDIEPPKKPTVIVGEKDLQKVMLRIQQDYTSGITNFRIIALIGLPGQGKTHFLKYWKNAIESKNAGNVVFLPRPFTSRGSAIFRATAESLLTEEMGLTRNLLAESMRDIMTNSEKQHQFESNLPYRILTGDSGLNKALKLLISDNRDTADAAFKWIAGLRLLSDERNILRKNGISVIINQSESACTDDRRSQGLILSLAKILILFTGKPFYLAIDELNALNNINSQARFRSYLDNIRALRQGATLLNGPLCLILACTPTAWSQIERIDPMLAERITKIHFLSGPGGENEVKQFLKYRFKKARETLPSESNGNPLYPLDSSHVSLLFKKIQESEYTKTWRTIIEIVSETLESYSEDDRRSLESIINEVSERVKKRKELRIRDPDVDRRSDFQTSRQLLIIRDAIIALSKQITLLEQRLLSLMPFIKIPDQIEKTPESSAEDEVKERLFSVSPFRYSIITIEQRAKHLEKIGNNLYNLNQYQEAILRYQQSGQILESAMSLCKKPGLWIHAILLALQAVLYGYLPAALLASSSKDFEESYRPITVLFENASDTFIDRIKLPVFKEILLGLQEPQLKAQITSLRAYLAKLRKKYETGFGIPDHIEGQKRMKIVSDLQDSFKDYKKELDKALLSLRIQLFKSNAHLQDSINAIDTPLALRLKQAYAIISNVNKTEEGLSPVIQAIKEEPLIREMMKSQIRAYASLEYGEKLKQSW
ncbi:MAG: hypothetical protein ACXACA_05560, partial [Candidatus Ranarchaeia archaeon]